MNGKRFAVKHISLSELGLIRESNQDRVLAIENDAGFLAVVCDGIGGGRAGDVASEIVVNTFEAAFRNSLKFDNNDDIIQWFTNTLDIANKEVFKQSITEKEYAGMGTTMIAVVIVNNHALGFNVGDSRLYEFRHSKLNLLSHDQTYAYQMYLQNEISIEEVQTHPRRNVLINAVGIKDNINFELIRVVDGWQRLMLSTDGLHDFVDHVYIEETFNLSLEESAKLLKKLAYQAGGFDNISFIMIEDEK